MTDIPTGDTPVDVGLPPLVGPMRYDVTFGSATTSDGGPLAMAIIDTRLGRTVLIMEPDRMEKWGREFIRFAQIARDSHPGKPKIEVVRSMPADLTDPG